LIDEDDAIHSTLNEIYGIVAEISISSDKIVQGQGNELRKLLEQLKKEVDAKKKNTK